MNVCLIEIYAFWKTRREDLLYFLTSTLLCCGARPSTLHQYIITITHTHTQNSLVSFFLFIFYSSAKNTVKIVRYKRIFRSVRLERFPSYNVSKWLINCSRNKTHQQRHSVFFIMMTLVVDADFWSLNKRQKVEVSAWYVQLVHPAACWHGLDCTHHTKNNKYLWKLCGRNEGCWPSRTCGLVL